MMVHIKDGMPTNRSIIAKYSGEMISLPISADRSETELFLRAGSRFLCKIFKEGLVRERQEIQN